MQTNLVSTSEPIDFRSFPVPRSVVLSRTCPLVVVVGGGGDEKKAYSIDFKDIVMPKTETNTYIPNMNTAFVFV